MHANAVSSGTRWSDQETSDLIDYLDRYLFDHPSETQLAGAWKGLITELDIQHRSNRTENSVRSKFNTVIIFLILKCLETDNVFVASGECSCN